MDQQNHSQEPDVDSTKRNHDKIVFLNETETFNFCHVTLVLFSLPFCFVGFWSLESECRT